MLIDWKKVDGSLDGNLFEYTHIAKVIGGWIVRYTNIIDMPPEDDEERYAQPSSSMVFIPDPNHEWMKKPV